MATYPVRPLSITSSLSLLLLALPPSSHPLHGPLAVSLSLVPLPSPYLLLVPLPSPYLLLVPLPSPYLLLMPLPSPYLLLMPLPSPHLLTALLLPPSATQVTRGADRTACYHGNDVSSQSLRMGYKRQVYCVCGGALI